MIERYGIHTRGEVMLRRWSRDGRRVRTLVGSLLGVILAVACALESPAQTPGQHQGRRFQIVFPDTIRAYVGTYRNPSLQGLMFAFFADEAAHVSIRGNLPPGAPGPGYSAELDVAPDSAATHWLIGDSAAVPARPFVDSINRALDRGFTITSDKPVSMVCYYFTHAGCEAFAPLPVESWGTEYRAASLRSMFIHELARSQANEEGTDITDAAAQIVVVAAEDSTLVVFKSPTDLHVTPDYWVRDTLVMLNAGQAAMVQTFYPGRAEAVVRDVSGTLITANKPIGVITGNPRTQGGFGANLTQTATGNGSSSGAFEWLVPTATHGATFVYRPYSAAAEDETEELIRVYATAPGTTTVFLSNGSAETRLEQGEHVTFSHSRAPGAATSFNEPFAIRTDKPAQATVVTGSYSRKVAAAEGELTLDTWAPSMSLLPPRESWYNLARFYLPTYPPWLGQYAVIAADSGAQLYLDGSPTPVAATPIAGTPFKHVRLPLAAGQHTLRAVRGRACVVAYGQSKGFESFKPFGTRKRETPQPAAHPTLYFEDISVGYAFPVYGVQQEAIVPDSVTIERTDGCDSAVIVMTRIGQPWTFAPYESVTDSAVNTDAEIVPLWNGTTAGYRIRFRPLDPAIDADAHITMTSPDGRRWTFPYSYRAHTLAIAPNPIALLDIKVNEEQLLPLTFTNVRSFAVTPRTITLANGGAGFTLRDIVGLNTSLDPGMAATATLAFTGAAKNTDYHDTIVVTTECGTYRVAIRARTGPYPIPSITGKDWGRRRVGSVHDTLSFVANAGSAPYTIRSITIDKDAARAFALVAPDWGALPPVAPAGRDSLGIRFVPPGMGPFAADLTLATADGDTVRALLQGIGTMPAIAAPDVRLGVRCLDSVADTSVVFVNTGNEPLTVTSLLAVANPTTLIEYDTAGATDPRPFLPRVLAPGEEMRVRMKITPVASGAIEIRVVAGSDALGGDSVAVIDGTARYCTQAKLTVDDHDFDSVFITLTKPGFVTVRNLGGGDARVLAMTLVDDTAGAFTLTTPALFTVPDSGSVRVFCDFTPATVGLKTARIEFATDVGPLVSRLRGVGRRLVVPAHIRRDYHGRPGEEVTIHVELDGRLDTLPIPRLDLVVRYRAELLDMLAAAVPEGKSAGWRWSVSTARDSVRVAIEPGSTPPAAGTIFSMRHLVRFDPLDHSELPFAIETGLPYVEVVASPGLFSRDPMCGFLERLFTLATGNFRLEQNVPNPLNGPGRIEFEIPFENDTRLAVFDALGREALLLLDEHLAPGVYGATIPAGALASGLYYYRLTSGEFTAMRKMVVQ